MSGVGGGVGVPASSPGSPAALGSKIGVAEETTVIPIVEMSTDECAVGEREGLFEKLDPALFKDEGYDSNFLKPSYILTNTVSYVIA